MSERKYLDLWRPCCCLKQRKKLFALLMTPMQVLFLDMIYILMQEIQNIQNILLSLSLSFPWSIKKPFALHFCLSYSILIQFFVISSLFNFLVDCFPLYFRRFGCLRIYKQHTTFVACVWGSWIWTCWYQWRHNFYRGWFHPAPTNRLWNYCS